MIPPNESPSDERKPRWHGIAAAGAIAVMVALSVAIYLGLSARGAIWPLFVLAVASAPLALLAAAQGIQAAMAITRKERE